MRKRNVIVVAYPDRAQGNDPEPFLPLYLLGKGGYVFGSVDEFVCLFVCLSVDNITQKSYERIGMKFYGRVLSSTRKN